MKGTVEERFWAKVDRKSDDLCWNWTAAVNKSGYGVIRVEGKTIYAHRLSYAIANEEIPDGLLIRHICSNTLCANPGHLETGDWSDNLYDAYRNGERGNGFTFKDNQLTFL